MKTVKTDLTLSSHLGTHPRLLSSLMGDKQVDLPIFLSAVAGRIQYYSGAGFRNVLFSGPVYCGVRPAVLAVRRHWEKKFYVKFCKC